MTQHQVEIETDQRDIALPGVGHDEHVLIYQPYCKTCDWVGDETQSESAAREQADEHVLDASRDQ